MSGLTAWERRERMLEDTLQAKLKEAEKLSAQIKQLDQESEEFTATILRWAVVGDETTALMIQAEEQLSPGRLAHLKAKINGLEVGVPDLWAKYRQSPWRLPRFGAPGPG